jgi:hypothetical protein
LKPGLRKHGVKDVHKRNSRRCALEEAFDLAFGFIKVSLLDLLGLCFLLSLQPSPAQV